MSHLDTKHTVAVADDHLKIEMLERLVPPPQKEVAEHQRQILHDKGIDDATLHEWRRQFNIFYAWTHGYNTVRLNYNREPQYFPLLIAELEETKQIQQLLTICKLYHFLLSIRGGGHDVLGYSLSPGSVFDLGRRNMVNFISEVRPSTDDASHPCSELDYRLIHVGAGARIMEVVKTVAKQNYAFASGTCGTVGMGLALGSGFGFLSRRYGLTIDTLVGVRVILADGQVVEASETSHPDLFWAIRGAGAGNYGIITDYTFKVFYLPKVLIAILTFPLYQLVPFMQIWQLWNATTDPNLTTALRITNTHITLQCQLDWVHCNLDSKGHINTVLCNTQSCDSKDCDSKDCDSKDCDSKDCDSKDCDNKNCADTKRCDADIDRVALKTLNCLLADFFKLKPEVKIFEATYTEAVQFFTNEHPKFQFHILSSYIVEPLDEKALSVLQRRLEIAPDTCIITCSGLGGRISAIDPNTTSFAYRDAIYWMQFQGAWYNFPDRQVNVDWVEHTYHDLLPAITNPATHVPRAYVGFKQLNLGEHYPQAYWAHNYPRLQKIKQQYDPHNVFHYPQSVKLPCTK